MAAQAITLLTFALDSQRFGIRIADIEEIIRAVQVAHLPKAPRMVEGLIDLHGTIVAVLDVRARFGLATRPMMPADHIVMARANGRLVGLRVDCALGVLTLAEPDIEASMPAASKYVVGVAKLPDGLLLIHDLATFLSDAEGRDVDALVEAGLPA